VTEQESTMSAVSEFQTAGAEQRKARSAMLVLVVGLQTRGVAEERSRRVTMRGWMSFTALTPTSVIRRAARNFLT